MAEPIVVPLGGVWESDAWEVHLCVRTDSSYRSRYNRMVMGVPAGEWGPWAGEPCRHAVGLTEGEVRHHPANPAYHSEGSWSQRREWTVPRVVVAYNEAGHATTGVCLDCIVEWGRDH